MCYTNHALDQFLEDLLDIGIPADAMIRLGGKSTPRTSPLGLQSQTSTWKPSQGHYALRNEKQAMAELLIQDVERYYAQYSGTVGSDDLMAYLEFEAEEYFAAFTVPASLDGMTMVDEKGRDLSSLYLLDRWQRGQDAGLFAAHPEVVSAQRIWKIGKLERQAMLATWRNEIAKETVSHLQSSVTRYNREIEDLISYGTERDASKLLPKRIVACTTTAAAKYSDLIQKSASPDVVLVEEAGEILESHVLTALGPQTRQLILIGDHKYVNISYLHILLIHRQAASPQGE